MLIEEEWRKRHYGAIKNRVRLLSKLTYNCHDDREYFCIYCLHSYIQRKRVLSIVKKILSYDSVSRHCRKLHVHRKPLYYLHFVHI